MENLGDVLSEIGKLEIKNQGKVNENKKYCMVDNEIKEYDIFSKERLPTSILENNVGYEFVGKGFCYMSGNIENNRMYVGFAKPSCKFDSNIIKGN